MVKTLWCCYSLRLFRGFLAFKSISVLYGVAWSFPDTRHRLTCTLRRTYAHRLAKQNVLVINGGRDLITYFQRFESRFAEWGCLDKAQSFYFHFSAICIYALLSSSHHNECGSTRSVDDNLSFLIASAWAHISYDFHIERPGAARENEDGISKIWTDQ